LPEARRSTEHPLSQALGGQGFRTLEVCDHCNRRAGQEIDQPFAAETMVLAARHRHRIPDARGKVPDAPRLVGQATDGVRVMAELTREGIITRRIPTAVRRSPSSEEYITDEGDGETVLDTRLRRLRRQVGTEYDVSGTVENVPRDSVARVNLSLDAYLWPRMMAKLALGFAGDALGPEWLAGQRATQLRDVLWKRGRQPPWELGLDPVPTRVGVDDPLAGLLKPPEHVIWISPAASSLILVFHLFGELRCGVDLCFEPPGLRIDATWVFDPLAGSTKSTTFTELAIDAINAGRFDAT
jgi:hypothetical protein